MAVGLKTSRGSVAELSQSNGLNGAPILLAVRGFVFDVTAGKDFYGPGGAYEVLAGRDASLGLAAMETDESKWPSKGTFDELTAMEADTLNDWLQRFEDKYPLMGFLPAGFDGRSLEEMTAAAQAEAEAEMQAEEEGQEDVMVTAAGEAGDTNNTLHQRGGAGSGGAAPVAVAAEDFADQVTAE